MKLISRFVLLLLVSTYCLSLVEVFVLACPMLGTYLALVDDKMPTSSMTFKWNNGSKILTLTNYEQHTYHVYGCFKVDDLVHVAGAGSPNIEIGLLKDSDNRCAIQFVASSTPYIRHHFEANNTHDYGPTTWTSFETDENYFYHLSIKSISADSCQMGIEIHTDDSDWIADTPAYIDTHIFSHTDCGADMDGDWYFYAGLYPSAAHTVTIGIDLQNPVLVDASFSGYLQNTVYVSRRHVGQSPIIISGPVVEY